MKVCNPISVSFWKEEHAQDVAEYCLLTALVALIALGIFWHVSGGLQGMWASMNASLITTNAAVSAPTGGISGH